MPFLKHDRRNNNNHHRLPCIFLLCLFLYGHMECYVKPKLVCHVHVKHANTAIFTYRYALLFNMTAIKIKTAAGFNDFYLMIVQFDRRISATSPYALPNV